MPTSEQAVLAQARLRAIYRKENVAIACAKALEDMAALKQRLNGDEYQEALEKLLEEYSKP